MTPSRQRALFTTARALGEDYRDLCSDPSCAACVCWPRTGEPRSDWLSRINGLVNATCRNGHPWPENPRLAQTPAQTQICRVCANESTRRKRARQGAS